MTRHTEYWFRCDGPLACRVPFWPTCRRFPPVEPRVDPGNCLICGSAWVDRVVLFLLPSPIGQNLSALHGDEMGGLKHGTGVRSQAL